MFGALRSVLWRALAYTLVLQALLVAAVLFWPNFRDNLSVLQLMAPIPVMRELGDVLAAGGVEAYVCAQQYFKTCSTLGTLAAVLFAMGAVAGEAQRGTLEIWLARPVSRRRLLLERWTAGALATTLPVYLTSATIPWLLGYVDESMTQKSLFLCSTHQALGLLVVYSATFLLSCLGRRPIAIAFGMLLFTTFQFALYMVKTVTHYSLYRKLDIQTFLEISIKQRLPLGLDAAMVGLIVVLLVASIRVFDRRTP